MRRRLGLESRATALRLLVAGATSALLVLLLWLTRSRQLSGHIDIVGNPTFSDYEYQHLFLAYRLAVYAFPLVAIAIYALLYRRGPLRGPVKAPRSGAVPLVIPAGVEPPPGRVRARARATRAGRGWAGRIPLTRWWGPALTGGFVALAASARSPGAGRVTGFGALCGLGYLLAVGAVAGSARVAARRRGREADWPFGACLGAVNAFGTAPAALGGLWFVSRHTEALLAGGSVRPWPWLPGWLAALGTAAALAWVARQLRRGRRHEEVEQRLRVVLLGTAAIYLLVAVLPGALMSFTGFDDAQDLTGASLLEHGLFPWRDFQFIHGFYPDVLQSLVGFHLFTPTAWGSAAGRYLVLVPLSWVALYLLGVWGARRWSLTVLAPLLLAAWGGLGIDARFLTIPVILILLGRALASPRLAWTAALTVALFVEGVVAPESDFQVLAVIAVVIAADVVHRPAGRWQWRSLRRSQCLLATGAGLTAVWVLFLATQHALGGWIDYFVVFGPGHNAEGDIPPIGIPRVLAVMFVMVMGLVALTVLSAAWRIRGRRPWTPLAWATLAAAINAGLYGEQAVARLDWGHIQLSVDAGLPLMVLSLAGAAPVIEAFVVSTWARRWPGRSSRWPRQPVSILAVLAAVVLMPSIRSHVWHVPGRTHTAIVAQVPGSVLGYASPGVPDPGLMADLRTTLDAYGSRHAPFFDMTNSPGYFYYLFGRRLASRFTNVSLAIPESAQRLLIGDLRRTRPPLVAFNSVTIGLPVWDNIQTEVRHFEISQFVLDRWTPLLATHGVLFLLRNDLLTSRQPPPHLIEPPATTDLYAGQPACDWGDAANFLTSSPSGPPVTLRAGSVRAVQQYRVSGWAFDPRVTRPPGRVVLAIGNQAVAVLPVKGSRPDVAIALHTPAATGSGFSATFTTTAAGPVGAYELDSDGALRRLAGSAGPAVASVRMPSGSLLPVRAPQEGHLEAVARTPERESVFTVPPSLSLPGYRLATFAAPTRIGASRLTLSDVPDLLATPAASTDITASSLPVTGSRLAVRVGSCLQWHGYRGHVLYLGQLGGAPITSLTLTGVRP